MRVRDADSSCRTSACGCDTSVCEAVYAYHGHAVLLLIHPLNSSVILPSPRRAGETAGAHAANERSQALLAEHKAKLAEAREFLADRQDAIQSLRAALTQKDTQVWVGLPAHVSSTD